jgi:hypothetical protein
VNMRRCSRFCAVPLVVALTGLTCGCAGGGPVPASSEIFEAPSRELPVELEVGADLCVRLASGEVLCGEVITVTADSVAVGVIDSPHPEGRMVARSGIVSLEPKKDSKVVGALVGGVTVVMLGIVALIALIMSGDPIGH